MEAWAAARLATEAPFVRATAMGELVRSGTPLPDPDNPEDPSLPTIGALAGRPDYSFRVSVKGRQQLLPSHREPIYAVKPPPRSGLRRHEYRNSPKRQILVFLE